MKVMVYVPEVTLPEGAVKSVPKPVIPEASNTFQSVGTVNDTVLIRSSPVPVSVTLTCCKKATAVSSAVDTSPAATSPARGGICKFRITLLSVKSASAIGAPQIAPSLSVSSALMVIVIFVISPLKFDGVAIRISGKLASSPVCPLAPVRALMVMLVPSATST